MPPFVLTPVDRILLDDAENFGNEPFGSVEFGDGAKLFDPDLLITLLAYFELVSLVFTSPDALFSLWRDRVPLQFMDGIPLYFIDELKN